MKQPLTTYHIGILQSQAYRNLHTVMTQLLAEHGLTVVQWGVLGLVHDAAPKSRSHGELAKTLGTSPAFITKVVQALEKKGFLEPQTDGTDKRVHSVRLSPSHIHTVEMIEASIRAGMVTTVDPVFSPRQRALYIKQIQKLAKLKV